MPLSDFTLILQRVQQGDDGAAAELLPLVYEELRRVAAAKLARESAMQTLQATALVHEAWLRLGGEAQPDWANRRHFLGAAAQAMRRILIDRARQRAAQRHGGGLERVPLDVALEGVAGFALPAAPGWPSGSTPAADDQLLAIAEALEELARVEPEKAELVQLRFFVGLTLEEAAATQGISVPTAKRRWAFARAWLFDALQGSHGGFARTW